MKAKSLFCIFNLFLIILGSSMNVQAADVTLRMHQFLPAKANVPKDVLEVWAKKVEKDSKGKIKVQHYPSMQLGGNPTQLYDQVVEGVADIVWFVNGYAPSRLPRTEVFELPFMMTDSEATSRAFWELGEEIMFDKDFREVKVLGLWVHGPGLIHSKKPITKMSDLNGVKLRAGSRILNKLFSDFGATPIGMPVPQVPQSLSKGVIDATLIPWEVTGALKVLELVSNHTSFGTPAIYTLTFVFAMNKNKYNSLPSDLKQVIDKNSGAKFSAFAGKVMGNADNPARDKAKKRGNNLITLSPQEIEKFKKASQPTIDNWVKEMDEKNLDGTGLLKKARALLAKHSK